MAIDITFTGVFTLKELLGFKTIPQLKEMARVLRIRFTGSPRKQSLVNMMAEILTENPDVIIKSMFYYELKACLDVIEGRMSLEYADNSGLLFELNRFGFIYAVDDKIENKSHLLFSRELADVLHHLIPAELERRETDGSLIAERLALGCANLYGFTDIEYLTDYIPQLEKRIGRTLEEEAEVVKLFYPFLCATNSGRGFSGRSFMSPFAVYNGFDVDNEGAVEWEEEAKRFDFDTILGYGEMPYPVIASRTTEKIKNLLKKYGKPGITPEHGLRYIWILKQDESRNTDFSMFEDILELKRISEVEKNLPLLTDCLNELPYWRLRGNSSKESYKRRTAEMRHGGQTPRISIGPNLRAMGIESFEQIQEMARRDESLQPYLELINNSNARVGRNDPCPCGSGKKYKHCCGR